LQQSAAVLAAEGLRYVFGGQAFLSHLAAAQIFSGQTFSVHDKEPAVQVQILHQSEFRPFPFHPSSTNLSPSGHCPVVGVFGLHIAPSPLSSRITVSLQHTTFPYDPLVKTLFWEAAQVSAMPVVSGPIDRGQQYWSFVIEVHSSPTSFLIAEHLSPRPLSFL
jgi:hypothetical protein